MESNRILYLEEKIKRNELLLNTILLLNHIENIDNLLNFVLEKSLEITKSDAGLIISKSDNEDNLKIFTYKGYEKHEIEKNLIKMKDEIIGYVFKDGIPKIINDIKIEPLYIPIRDDINSRIIIPLSVDNNVYGILCLESVLKNAYNEDDLQILISISNVASFIYSKMILTEKLKNKIKQKDILIDVITSLDKSEDIDKIFDYIMIKLSENFNIIRGMLVTFEDEELNILSVKKSYNITEEEMQRGVYKVGEGIVGKVVKEGIPIVIPNIHEEKEFLNRMKIKRDKSIPNSFIAVPIRVEGIIIGVIAIEKIFKNMDELNEDKDLMIILSNFIAGKIKNISDILKEKKKLIDENISLRQEIMDNYNYQNIIGKNKKMIEIFKLIRSVADSEASVLILGESGTGKEIIAKAIHYSSSRRDGPFISINCAAIPENLLESELFGYKKGAFTGAISDKKGKFQLANRGTLFLDEIGDMPLYLQAKILRVLQDKEIEPIGSETKIKVDIRVLAATNKPIDKWVKEGKFREDLYYRINVIEINIPPLRERKDDIPILVNSFIEKFSKKNNRNITGITPNALLVLQNYNWPGNVRELENIIERAVILCEKEKIDVENLPAYLIKDEELPEINVSKWLDKILENNAYSQKVYDVVISKIEKELINKALIKFNRNQIQSAEYLGINRNTLKSKIDKYNLL